MTHKPGKGQTGRSFSRAHVLAIGNARMGTHHSEETKQKISDALSGRIGNVHLGELNPNWKGGYRRNHSGSPMWYMPDHPRARTDGCVLGSHLEAEEVLGRYLKDDEVVHHINGDCSDNRRSNLLICTRGYHMWLHHRIRTMRRTRHAALTRDPATAPK